MSQESKISLEDLVERFIEERPADVEEFVQRHPQHAAELREMLPAMQEMEEVARTFATGSRRQRLALLDRWRAARERLAAGHSLREITIMDGGEASSGSSDFVKRVLARLESPEPPLTRYETTGEIARGGQGVVLAVWDEKLHRHLAMKVALAPADASNPGMPRTNSLSRFLEEAHVTAQLDHPGIVPVHDLGLDPERRVYFTMKLVKGRDLRAIIELVRKGAEGWTETRAVNVLLKVCEAMAYAHAKGVIHRDLKPSNVMVGRFGEVYVMDWGLARVQGSEDRRDIRIQPELTSSMRSPRPESDHELDSPLVTMDGDVVGTPAFMPPEQARGELESIGPHSDVYAVGAMLYQLLTDQMPYVSAGSRLTNRAVWALVQEGPPDAVQALAKDVPGELVAICEKAMAREVGARYAHMGELAEDLRAYLDGRVVRAYEAGVLAELKKWVRRNRRLAGTIAAAFVALLGLTAVYLRHLNASNLALDAKNRSLRASGLASASLEAAGTDSMLSLLLAREAVRVDPTPENVAELHRAVGEVREQSFFDLESAVFETAFSPHGDVFLTVAEEVVTLWDLVGKRLSRLVHDGPVYVQPVFSSDGDWVLTASQDGIARRWDLQGHELTRFEHGLPIWSATLSPDERHVLTGSVDGSVKLWERDGRLVTEWRAHEGEVLDMSFSPDGELLVTGGSDGTAKLWMLSETSASRAVDLAEPTGAVTHVQFAPSGDRILTVAGLRARWVTPEPGGRAWLWDQAGALLATLNTFPEGGIRWAGFSPAGDRILSFGLGGTTQLWDGDGRLLASGENPTKARMFPGGFSPTGDLMVGPAVDRRVWLFDSSLQRVAGLFGHDSQVISAHFSPNGRLLLTGCMDKTARLWDVMPLELPEYRGHGGTVFSAIYSPDGALVVSASDDQTARIWNADGSLRRILRGHRGVVSWAEFSTDGQWVLTSSEDKTARIWDLAGNELRAFNDEEPLWSAAFSHRGDRIVTAGRGGAVSVWDVEERRVLCRIATGRPTRRAAFLPDDLRILLTGGTSAYIYTVEGKLERVFGPHDDRVLWAEISPSGDAVLTAGAGKNPARLWSMEGKLLRVFQGHDAGTASFSPDGTLIVTASSDKTARVWDLEGNTLSILRGHRGSVSFAVFSPDGRRILTASDDGTVRTWLADTGELFDLADRRIIRDFTSLELARYSDLLELPASEAWELVARIRSELLLKDKVIARLTEMQELDSRVRETALRMARTLRDDSAQDLNTAAWGAVRAPDASAESCEWARGLAEAACALEPMDANMRNTLGAALYRGGRFDEAMKALDLSMELDKSGRLLAENLVFLAMTRFRLGQAEGARQALAEMRALPGRRTSAEVDALVEEAEALLGTAWGMR
jgi:WD40 repeat protein/serine/threonine protein kinase